MAKSLRLIRSMDAVQRRAEIHGAGAERIFDAARHVARQVRPARPHLRGRCPARPFLLRRNAVDAAPAEAITADADAITQCPAVAEDEIKPALGGVDQDGAGRVLTREADGLARDRA